MNTDQDNIRRLQREINEQLAAELKNKEQTSVTVGIKDKRVVLAFAGHPLSISMTAEEARQIASLLRQGANELERKTDTPSGPPARRRRRR